jgi:hypothetical protein
MVDEAEEQPPFHLMGYLDDPPARFQMAQGLPWRTFAQALPEAMVEEPKDVYLYKAWKDVLGSYPDYPAQEIGDCTSFGSGHALDLLQCIEIALGKQPIAYSETCTEAIYGMGRELAHMLGRGDGCYGVAVTKALTEGGAVTRELVGPYSGARAKEWGKRGVPKEIKGQALAYKVGAATLVTDCEELDAALNNGFPGIVCSSQGFTMKRDEHGVCAAKGTWQHCMGIAGRRTRNGRREYLIPQSWGSKTPSGPLSDDQPPFSFWIDERPMSKMLAREDSLVIAKFGGFQKRSLPGSWSYAGMFA